MLWLTDRDVQQLIDLPALVAGVDRVFGEFGRGKVANPHHMRIEVPEIESMFFAFPAYVPSLKAFTVKVLSGKDRNPDRGLPFVQGVVVMLDEESGKPLAIMEAGYITAARTAATSAVATNYMAPKDVGVMGILGTGIEARTHMRLLSLVRTFSRILVCSPSGAHDRARALAREMSEELGRDVTAIESVAEVLQQSDVVSTVTLAKKPLFPAKLVRPGSHVNVVGRFRPNAYEVDPALLTGARVVSDEPGRLAEAWAHSKEPALAPGVLDQIASLADVVNRLAAARLGPETTTVFMSAGMSMEDTVAARLVYERAVAEGVGQRLA